MTGKHGLETYGQKGDPFDPHIHEALLHSHAEGIDGPTCVEILQPGYRVGDRILRPARVAVAEPDPDAPVAELVEGPDARAGTRRTRRALSKISSRSRDGSCQRRPDRTRRPMTLEREA